MRCLDEDEEELCFLELEPEEWCFDEEPDGILAVYSSFSVSEPERELSLDVPRLLSADGALGDCEKAGKSAWRGVVCSSDAS